MDYDENTLNSAPTMGPGRDVSTKRPPFPDEPSLGSAPTMGGRTTPPHGRLRPGDVLLGRYTVLAELGEGGMGVVYKCLDNIGGIEVAVKCLPPELSRNESKMEGIRENYAIVSRLHHSAISGLRQLEKDPDFGEYYLVMDLAKGEDLSTILRRRRGAPMPLDEALAILRPLASALDYAHGEKVLHRDVKPANVKVETLPAEASQPLQVESRKSESQKSRSASSQSEPARVTLPPSLVTRNSSLVTPHFRVQLLDFGLAAEVRSSMSRVSLRGHSGSSGTPAYMAPEQWEARRQSAATDQYSLAVMAYQMLSGYLPFDAVDQEMLRRAVLTRAPEEIEGVPAHVNAALLKALAKNPKERFASCTEFVESCFKPQRTQKSQREFSADPQVMRRVEAPPLTDAAHVLTLPRRRGRTWQWLVVLLLIGFAIGGVVVLLQREVAHRVFDGKCVAEAATLKALLDTFNPIEQLEKELRHLQHKDSEVFFDPRVFIFCNKLEKMKTENVVRTNEIDKLLRELDSIARNNWKDADKETIDKIERVDELLKPHDVVYAKRLNQIKESAIAYSETKRDNKRKDAEQYVLRLAPILDSVAKRLNAELPDEELLSLAQKCEEALEKWNNSFAKGADDLNVHLSGPCQRFREAKKRQENVAAILSQLKIAIRAIDVLTLRELLRSSYSSYEPIASLAPLPYSADDVRSVLNGSAVNLSVQNGGLTEPIGIRRVYSAGKIQFDPLGRPYRHNKASIIPHVADDVLQANPLYILRRENSGLVLRRALIQRNEKWGIVSQAVKDDLILGEPLFQIL